MPKMKLSYRWRGNAVGDTVEVTEAEARDLVRSGRAVPANKTSAKAVASAIPASTTTDKES